MKNIIEMINKTNDDKFVSTIVITAVSIFIFYLIMLNNGLAQKWAFIPLLICLIGIFVIGFFVKKGGGKKSNKKEVIDLC